MIEEARALLTPTTTDRVIAALDLVAETLSVETPSERAIAVYCQLLCELPEDVLLDATRAVLKSHAFNSFPRPADFLRHAESAVRERKAIVSRLTSLKARLHVARLYYPREPASGLSEAELERNRKRIEKIVKRGLSGKRADSGRP